MDVDIGILGCGVAGLTAALSCAYHGLTVEIFDKTTDVGSPVGAGFALNGGLLALTKMGYRHIFDDLLVMPEQSILYKGNETVSMNMAHGMKGTPLDGHFGVFTRRVIISRLVEEVKKNEKIKIFLSHKATRLSQNENSATMEFEDGEIRTYKAVIAADGIHSLGKKTLFPSDQVANPVHSGFCVYYGILSSYPEKMDHRNTYELDCDGSMMLILPLVDGEGIFVLVHSRTHEDDPNAWTYPCSVDDLHKMMLENKLYERQCMMSENDIRKLNSLLHLGIYQNQILPKWSEGRICLIGDAAHATSPALGQGANQAMQDGYLIGKHLATEKSPEKAFERLFDERHNETKNIIKGSQWSGLLRSGSQWYARIFRWFLRLAVRYIPSVLINNIVTGFTPIYATDEFLADVQKMMTKKNL